MTPAEQFLSRLADLPPDLVFIAVQVIIAQRTLSETAQRLGITAAEAFQLYSRALALLS
jgi:hypothetical protein